MLRIEESCASILPFDELASDGRNSPAEEGMREGRLVIAFAEREASDMIPFAD